MNYSVTSLIRGVICYEKYVYQCISVCLCRWVHAVCESLYTEDEVEQASDEGFACTSCSAYVPKPVGKSHTDFKNYGFKNIHRIFSYLLMTCFSFAFYPCFLPLFTVVESAIMASIKIKEPG